MIRETESSRRKGRWRGICNPLLPSVAAGDDGSEISPKLDLGMADRFLIPERSRSFVSGLEREKDAVEGPEERSSVTGELSGRESLGIFFACLLTHEEKQEKNERSGMERLRPFLS